jgi:DNA polymerase-1
MKSIYLIDGMSVVYRAYYAMSNSKLTNPKGEPSGALSGFANQLDTLIRSKKPEYIAVVFDVREPTFRHIMYPEYKANRAVFPEEMEIQMPKIKNIIDLLGIPQLEKPGYEADDIIGTLAKKMANEETTVFCITADKDYYQLVDDNIFLLKSDNANYEPTYVNTGYVISKTGVHPDHIIDLMALIGDASDNIPGVKGVGPKTGLPLIQKYETIENLYNHIDEIEKDSLRQKLIENKELAMLSKELVTIETDVEMDVTLDSLRIKEPDYPRLDAFLKSEGMERLRLKWFDKWKKATKDSPQEQEEEVCFDCHTEEKVDYRLVDEEGQLQELVKYLSDFTEFAFDLETSSLDTYNCDVVGISISAEPKKAFYISVESDEVIMLDLFTQAAKYKGIPKSTIIQYLKPLLENDIIGKYGQNIKFDAGILRRWDIYTKPLIFDSMLASYLLNPDDRHNMDDLSRKWLNYSPIPITELIGDKKKDQISMKDIDPSKIKNYACEDADVALQLKQKLEIELKTNNLESLANDIEFPLVNVLINMESTGVAIDSSALKELSKKLENTAAELRKQIFMEAGTEFNIDSPKQLSEVLYEKMLIPTTKKTKTGFSTDVSVLNLLANDYKIADYLLEYRSLQKLKSTYIDVLPTLIHQKTGRIHTTYNQAIAGTGRLTSTDPNLQNIPIKTPLGKEIRRAFIPQNPDDFIFAADYSQIELRIMAFICKDEKMIKSFNDGIDIHTATAATLYEKSPDEVTKDERRDAKTVNFGIMYGLGSFGLSQRLNINRNRSKEMIENYFEKYPKIKNYMDDTIKFTQENGFAETLFGRRRYFTDINSKNFNLRSAAERAAINMPIQGSAADMMKVAMIRIDNEMRKMKFESRMILQVHDELVFEAKQSELEDLKELVVRNMSSALSLGDVPVVVETGIGKNWYESH